MVNPLDILKQQLQENRIDFDAIEITSQDGVITWGNDMRFVSNKSQVLAVRPTPFADAMRLYMLSHSGAKTHTGAGIAKWQGAMVFVTPLEIADEKDWQLRLFDLAYAGKLPHFGKNPHGVTIAFNWGEFYGAVLPSGETVKCCITIGYSSTYEFLDPAAE